MAEVAREHGALWSVQRGAQAEPTRPRRFERSDWPADLLAAQAGCCRGARHRRRIPFAGQRLRIRCVEPHGQVEASLRRREPVGLLVLAGILVLNVEYE